MGEVYLAEDTRLGRKVALKILLESNAGDDETRRRFGQEARAASALNHPNIITIYEVGSWNGLDYIAMEYADGESVRSLISSGRLQLNDALTIAVQIASALSAAHSAGIVHRDIKPENVIRRSDGLVKVLDFGLAKHTPRAVESGISNGRGVATSPLLTSPGMVMGTLPYMSPEQVRGKTVDARSDVWSLGVLLYEMISGRHPFEGETKSDLLAAILTSEPEPLFVRTEECSLELEDIIRQALTKDREQRYQWAKDLEIDLKALQSELQSGELKTERMPRPTVGESVKETGPGQFGVSVGAVDSGRAPRRGVAILALSTLVAAAAGLFLFYRPGDTAAGEAALGSSLITSWKSVAGEAISNRPRISPDGKLIAFSALKGGRRAIWVKQLAGGEPFGAKDSDTSNTSPIWSPDGQRLAYVADDGAAGFSIWTSLALGGSAGRVGGVPGRSPVELVHWSKDGAEIYFERARNLYTMNAATGEVRKLTSLDETIPSKPSFAISPDEQRLAFVDSNNGQIDLFESALDGSGRSLLTNDVDLDWSPVWHPDGQRVIYSTERRGTKQIFAVSRTLREQPVRVSLSDSDQMVSDISADGRTIVYTSSKDDADLWAIDMESGAESQMTAEIGPEYWLDASADGRLVYQALARTSVGSRLLNSPIFAQPVEAGAQPVEISSDGFAPQWSPDGTKVSFLRLEGGVASLWLATPNGGDARRLTQSRVTYGEVSLLPLNRGQVRDFVWSPDSRYLVYSAARNGAHNIWRVDTAGGGEQQLTANSDPTALFFGPAVSPDGATVAWTSFRPASSVWEIQVLTNGIVTTSVRTNSRLRLLGWNARGDGLIAALAGEGSSMNPGPIDLSIVEAAISGRGGLRTLRKCESTYIFNTVLSPDRRSVAFVSQLDNTDAIKLASLAGPSDAPPRTLAVNRERNVYFSSLVFSPDGKFIYFAKQASWQVISSINNFK